MDILKKLPQKQVKLIIVLVSLLIVACAYFFGFQRFNKKAELIRKENISLTTQRNELMEKSRNETAMTEEINIMREKYELIIDEFPSDLTQDKSIMFIYNLSKLAGMKINVIGLSEKEFFYSPFGYTDTPIETSTEGADTVQASSSQVLLGYKTKINISYSSTYDGLKKCISHINDNKDRMNVASFTAAFDQTSGILSGTMLIDFYALSGTDKEFEEPVIESVPIGTENIFGTFETPIDFEKPIDLEESIEFEDPIDLEAFMDLEDLQD